MPKSSRKKTRGKFPRKLTWRAYASGPVIAVEFEIRICSNRNAPTGIIPESECSRRNRNEVPCPARNGATAWTATAFTAGAEELADATKTPYEIK
jgi:hypothetical protein